MDQSVNDGISSEEFSLQYVTVDNAISLITQHGPGAYLAKVDVKSAFRTCPVRREDWSLLGIEWDGKYYFERVLPFGLRSSPFIFNTVADALEWILQNKFCLPAILHYLDDYLNVCAGPFLGILLDTTRCEARLPPDKLADLRDILRQCNSRNSITKNELASLLGKLSFAARVIVPGRTLYASSVGPEGQVRPSKDQATLSGSSRRCMPSRYQVVECLPRRLERQVFLPPQTTWTQATELGLYTDASGAWGFGAFYGVGATMDTGSMVGAKTRRSPSSSRSSTQSSRHVQRGGTIGHRGASSSTVTTRRSSPASVLPTPCTDGKGTSRHHSDHTLGGLTASHEGHRPRPRVRSC